MPLPYDNKVNDGCCDFCSGQKDETLLSVLQVATAETIELFPAGRKRVRIREKVTAQHQSLCIP